MTMVILGVEKAGLAPAPQDSTKCRFASHSKPHTKYSQTHPSPPPSGLHKTDPPAHAVKLPPPSVPCGKPHPRPAHRDKTSSSSADTARWPRPSPDATSQSSA